MAVGDGGVKPSPLNPAPNESRRGAETFAWSGIRVPALWIVSEDRRPFSPNVLRGEIDRRAAMMPHVTLASIPGTSHNVHHDEPGRVAGLVERFIEDPSSVG